MGWGSAGAKQRAGKAAVTAQGRADRAETAVHLQRPLMSLQVAGMGQELVLQPKAVSGCSAEVAG